ncbi:hypothetical protein CH063_12696 [Colletotrichum higginsianum]|uniref:Uncharacterized protein n=1 Tax=Colletotrichum higginsianum (strain IMI 349063) TaxID=759273 RepID=H1VRE5_COLHI|nr:hypothetical protein CH063_12696 [Colletotrichum higginsianum]
MPVLDTSTNAGVRHAFAERVPQRPEGVEEDRLVGVLDDDSSSSEDEDEGEEGEKDGDDSMDED